MTNQEKRVYGLMRRVVWLLHGGKCYLSGQELDEPGIEGSQGNPWEIHHAMHQGTYPHMRFYLGNTFPLAVNVHGLDNKGELAGLLQNEMGDRAWFELHRLANIITSPDLYAIESNFKSIIRRGHA